jgi:hypothetical protein
MSILKMGLTGLTANQLVGKCRTIEGKLNGNPAFPTPVPALADLTAQRELLETWITNSADGSRSAIATRRAEYATLLEMMKSLARYVSQVANGDAAIILSSGFDVRRAPEPIERLSRPVISYAQRDTDAGVADLKWERVRGSYSYVVEITSDDTRTENAVWTQVAVTTTTRCHVENLNYGTVYTFRVRAIGGSGLKSSWSDVAQVAA